MTKNAPLSADMLKSIIGGTSNKHLLPAHDIAFVEPESLRVIASGSKAGFSNLPLSKLDGANSAADIAMPTGAPVIHNGEGEGAWASVKKELHLDWS